MFNDDFEEMLEAVCEAVENNIPIPTQPKPKARSNTNPKYRKIDDNRDYVPAEELYVQSRHIMSSMKSSVTKERLSPAQAATYIKEIKNAVIQHGNIHIDESHFPNIGILYPREAVEAILLARTKYWPGYKLDEVLESIMYKFFMEHPDVQEFVHGLGEEIEKTKSLKGVLLRLNLQAIAPSATESISIKTKFGTIKQTKIPRHTAFVGEIREKMQSWLQQQKAFNPNIRAVYHNLEQLDKEYSDEQKLLSWLGYIVTRAMAENAKQIKIKNNRGNLLLESKPTVANIRR
jgi:hypothetical protein